MKKSYPKKNKNISLPKIGHRVGLLGGGQLARMMSLKTHELGIIPVIYCQNNSEPAALTTAFSFTGENSDEKKLTEFLKSCDVCTFESEFLDGDLLQKISTETQTPIYPNPMTMKLLQDRSSQKKLLQQFNIPTAPHLDVSQWEDLENAISKLGSSLVLKKRRFGYDGNGTFFLDSKNAKNKNYWIDLFSKNQTGFIAEQKIKFKNEKAILLARDQYDQILVFPLVESKQTQARCDWVMGPTKHNKLSPLIKKLKTFLKKINYVGVIAFELFDTGSELLINEIAPRVHNSGHYTQNAMEYDQFQIHIMAISGFKFPNKNHLLTKGFAMANLIGESSQNCVIKSPLNNHFHWYQKKENRPGRKMGHINALAENPKLALKKVILDRLKVQR